MNKKGTTRLADGIEEALARVAVTHPVEAETLRGYMAQIAGQIEATWLDGVPEDLSLAAVKLARRVQALQSNGVYAIVLFKMRGGELIYSVHHEGRMEHTG